MASTVQTALLLSSIVATVVGLPSEIRPATLEDNPKVSQLINSVLAHSLRAGGSPPISPELIPTFAPHLSTSHSPQTSFLTTRSTTSTTTNNNNNNNNVNNFSSANNFASNNNKNINGISNGNIFSSTGNGFGNSNTFTTANSNINGLNNQNVQSNPNNNFQVIGSTNIRTNVNTNNQGLTNSNILRNNNVNNNGVANSNVFSNDDLANAFHSLTNGDILSDANSNSNIFVNGNHFNGNSNSQNTHNKNTSPGHITNGNIIGIVSSNNNNNNGEFFTISPAMGSSISSSSSSTRSISSSSSGNTGSGSGTNTNEEQILSRGILSRNDLPGRPQTAATTSLSLQNAPIRGGQCRAGFSVRKGLVRPNREAGAAIRVFFQDVLTNAGGWEVSRQQFEAPCTGLYFFSFHAISTENDEFTMALMKNGEFQVTAYGAKGGYNWGSNSALLFLNPGDKVYLELQQGAFYEHPYNEAYTTFSGFLATQF